jgi:hypothetical protein
MLGIFLASGALFWVGFTADPAMDAIVPILGTGVYAWRNMSIIVRHAAAAPFG